MFWLRLFTAGVVIIFAALAIVQVIIPAIQGRRLFPMFRKTEAELNEQIQDLHQKIHEQELQDEVDRLKAQLHPVTPSETPAPAPEPSPETPATSEVKEPATAPDQKN